MLELDRLGVETMPVRPFWFILGCCALVLGVAGVLLPILPTTPFVILAAFAFGKSAPQIQKRLEESRTFGPAIRDWRATGAIAPRFKVIAVLMMSAAFCLSVIMSVGPTVLIIQGAAIAAAAAFILSRPNS